MTLGERIKKRRIELNITQTQLAKMIDKALRTIQDYEANKVTPPIDVIAKIARALNISPGALAYGNLLNHSKWEMETIINYNAEERHAELYTRDRAVMHKLDKLVEECPEVYSLKEHIKDKGKTWSKTYIISDKKYISLRKPVKMTEEKRAAMAERLKANVAAAKA